MRTSPRQRRLFVNYAERKKGKNFGRKMRKCIKMMYFLFSFLYFCIKIQDRIVQTFRKRIDYVVKVAYIGEG